MGHKQGRIGPVLSVLLFLFSSVSPALAAPAYGTKLPRQNEFFFGFQHHAVLERDLEGDNGEVKSGQQFLLISYGITDWLSLDLKGGAGNIYQTPDGGSEITYPTYLGGGYGFRVKFFDRDKTRAVFGFQHISIHPFTASINGNKHKSVLDDWQLSFLASHDIFHTTPYLGFKWSRMDYIHWVNTVRNRVKSDDDDIIGLVAGIDIPVHEKVWLNLEGQFIDVMALAASVNFKF